MGGGIFMKTIGALLLFLQSFNALANYSIILGLKHDEGTVVLPEAVCVFPGHELRLLADVEDPYHRRYGLPAKYFAWQLTQWDGLWMYWEARNARPFGPFSHGRERNSIYVLIPDALGPHGWLEIGAPRASTSLIELVDPSQSDHYCEWTHPDVYTVDDDDPSPEPTPPSAIPCLGHCVVGMACSDGCPDSAECVWVDADEPFWEVRSCE